MTYQDQRSAINVENQAVLSRIPAVTLGFWAIKIVATTLGEVGGNAVTLTLGFGYLISTAIFAAALVVLLAAQIRASWFHPLLYWAVITATTLAGTTLADFCDRSLGIGYLGGSLLLFTLVVVTLVLWQRTLGTVAVETVTTPKGLQPRRSKPSIWQRSCSHRRSAPRSAIGWQTASALATTAALC